MRIPQPDGDEPVLTASQSQNLDPQSNPAPGLAKATASAEDLDEFDIFADELAGDWERVTDPMIAPILELAANSKNYEEFQAGLTGLIQEMDVDALAETLAQAQFAANIYGRVKDQLKD